MSGLDLTGWDLPLDRHTPLGERLIADTQIPDGLTVFCSESKIQDLGPCLIFIASREEPEVRAAATAVTWRAIETSGEQVAREVLDTLIFRDGRNMLYPNPPMTRPRFLLVHDIETSYLTIEEPALLWP